VYISSYYSGALALGTFVYEEGGKINGKFHHRIGHEDPEGE